MKKSSLVTPRSGRELARSMMGKEKMVTYTLYCNQGEPGVFVDGTSVGIVRNGTCVWTAKEYKKDVTITLSSNGLNIPNSLETITEPLFVNDEEYNTREMYFRGDPGTTNEWRLQRKRKTTITSHSAKTSANLLRGTTEITINYTSDVTSTMEDMQMNTYVVTEDLSRGNITFTKPSETYRIAKCEFKSTGYIGYGVEDGGIQIKLKFQCN